MSFGGIFWWRLRHSLGPAAAPGGRGSRLAGQGTSLGLTGSHREGGGSVTRVVFLPGPLVTGRRPSVPAFQKRAVGATLAQSPHPRRGAPISGGARRSTASSCPGSSHGPGGRSLSPGPSARSPGRPASTGPKRTAAPTGHASAGVASGRWWRLGLRGWTDAEGPAGPRPRPMTPPLRPGLAAPGSGLLASARLCSELKWLETVKKTKCPLPLQTERFVTRTSPPRTPGLASGRCRSPAPCTEPRACEGQARLGHRFECFGQFAVCQG